MRRIVDKIILIALSVIWITGIKDISMQVIVMLMIVSVAAINLYFKNRIYIAGAIFAYLLLCLWCPQAVVFVPVLIYDEVRYKLKISGLITLICFIYYVREFDIKSIVVLIVICGLAALLERGSSKEEVLIYDLKRIRDNSAELNMLLKEKNRDLMEKQDYEIYLATLKERNRIAREIHDNVGHMLSRSILQMGAIMTINKEEQLTPHLKSVSDTLNQAMNSIRESVHDLHDDAIDLKQAIEDAVANMTDYDVNVDCDISIDVPRQVKYCFISIVNEAMSNVVKHSNATKVKIILREHPGFFQLFIEDNGLVKKRAEDNRGIGLDNMEERVSKLNGTFRIDTDKGFKIYISVPKNIAR